MFNSTSTRWVSFSLKPDVAINKTDMDLSAAKFGELEVSVRLASNGNVIFGDDAPNYEYRLRNLRVEYDVLENVGNKSPVKMETIYSIRNTISGTNSVISSTVPALCDTFYAVFHRVASLNNPKTNSLVNENIPEFKSLTVGYNSEQNRFISYRLDSLEETLLNFQEAVTNGYDNGLSLANINSGSGFAVGMNFRSLLDLRNHKFSMNLMSNIQSDNQYAVYMMFRAVIEV